MDKKQENKKNTKIIDQPLTEEEKETVDHIVERVISEYGEVLRKLKDE